jgi:hypothetical protein
MKYTSQADSTPTVEVNFVIVERGFEGSQPMLEDMIENPEQSW